MRAAAVLSHNSTCIFTDNTQSVRDGILCGIASIQKGEERKPSAKLIKIVVSPTLPANNIPSFLIAMCIDNLTNCSVAKWDLRESWRGMQ